MRVVKANLVRNIIRTERCFTQHFLRLVDPGRCQIFFEGLAGLLAEDHAEMAGTEIYQGCDLIEG